MRKNPTQEEIRILGEAYLMGEDISNSPDGQAMALAQADRVIREFRKLQKKIEVVFTDRDPYSSFEELRQDVESNRRMYVYTGSSETPLWSPQVNWMARAVHDWDHLVAGVDFSLLGELEAYRYTASKAPELEPLYLSEIALQAASSQLGGGFAPGRQKLVRASAKTTKLARELRANARTSSVMKQTVWDAAGFLRFMSMPELMVHLRSEGLSMEEALRVVLAAELLEAHA